MIAVDTNILVYAHRGETPFHAVAKARVAALAQGLEPWGIPIACLQEFLAVSSNPKLFTPASTPTQAFAQIEAWRASPSLTILHSTERHLGVLQTIATKAHLVGGQYHDARIAAICLEHGVTKLWTADRDFCKVQGFEI